MSANPYWMFSWQDLGRIAEELSEQLRQQVPTRERADLDTRLAYLLAELSSRIRPAPSNPVRPEFLFRNDLNYIVDGYWRQAESNLRNARMRELNEAVGYVLGGEGRKWTHDVTVLDDGRRESRFTVAGASDAGLHAMLQELQREAMRRRGTREPADRGEG